MAKWDFPNCLGSVDGKHIRIVKPSQSGSFFFNYKGFHSIVLLGVVNANCEFIFVDVGTNGRVSDGGVLEHTSFFRKLIDNRLNIPGDRQVCNTETILPFVFIGDEAFALRSNFLKPFNLKQLNYQRKIFNYRLSRARNTVECTFGILSSRFRILHTEINLKVSKVTKVTLACCVLHNFLRSKSDGYLGALQILDNDAVTPDLDSTRMIPLQRTHHRHSSQMAQDVRDQFLRYFNEVHRLPWQHDRVTFQPQQN